MPTLVGIYGRCRETLCYSLNVRAKVNIWVFTPEKSQFAADTSSVLPAFLIFFSISPPPPAPVHDLLASQ